MTLSPAGDTLAHHIDAAALDGELLRALARALRARHPHGTAAAPAHLTPDEREALAAWPGAGPALRGWLLGRVGEGPATSPGPLLDAACLRVGAEGELETPPSCPPVDLPRELASICVDLALAGYWAFARHLAELCGLDASVSSFGPELTPYVLEIALRRAAPLAREGEGERALALLHLAWASTRSRPLLLLTYGLAGSGKSTLSRHISQRLGLHLVRSDVVHKRLAGVRPDQRLETGFLSGAYTQEAKARTYVALLEYTREYLDKGEGVIVDASFGYPYMRDPFMAAIGAEGWDHALLHVEVDEGESHRRLIHRAAEGKDASDATWEIYLKQREAFVPPLEVARRVHIDGTLPPERASSALVERLCQGG